MYSAVHHEGRRLYELARRGVEVERASRRVTVHALSVEALEGASVTLRIVCGKGTYVRVLAADLGAALGCGAAVEHLVRTRVGPYGRHEALSWAQLTSADGEALRCHLRAPATALAGWRAVVLSAREAAAFVHGQGVVVSGLSGQPRELVRVHDTQGELLGIGAATEAARVQPVRILNADGPRTAVLSV
jgi:tRNA pseudouridine55 synthase